MSNIRNKRMFNSPEEQFLINIIRYDGKKELKQNLAKVYKKHLSQNESTLYPPIKPILYFKTKDFYKEIRIPENVFKKWKNSYLWTIDDNEQKIELIKELAGEFKNNNIDLIFMKGAAEILTIYAANIGLRLMNDIDIMIKLSDFNRAEKIFENLGFRYIHTSKYVGDERFSKLHSLEMSRLYKIKKDRHPAGPFDVIGLHWSFLDETDYWKGCLEPNLIGEYFTRKENVTLGDINVLLPCPDNIFETAIIHGLSIGHFPNEIHNNWQFDSAIYARKYEWWGSSYLLLLSFRLQEIIKYFGNKLDWDHIMGNLIKVKSDARIRYFFSICRFCGMEDIPERFYSAFNIPKNIDDKHWDKLTRQVNAFYIKNAVSLFRKSEINFRQLVASLVAYLFGINNLVKIRILYRKIFRKSLI